MFKPTLASGSTIIVQDQYIFADILVRNAYFEAHPSELVDNLYVYVTDTTSLYQYKTTGATWLDITPVVKGSDGSDGTDGADGTSINVSVQVGAPIDPTSGDIWVDTDEELMTTADDSVLWNGVSRPTLAGQGGKFLAVKSDGSGFEFQANITLPGTPTAPTAAIGTNNTQIATTAYADRYVPQPGSCFFPTYLYTSGGAKKAIGTYQYHSQISAVDGDYFLFPVFCNGTETIIDLNIYKTSANGKFDIYVNDVLDSSGYDGYASSSAHAVTSTSLSQPVIAGWNTIKIVVNGTNGSAYSFKTCGMRLR